MSHVPLAWSITVCALVKTASPCKNGWTITIRADSGKLRESNIRWGQDPLWERTHFPAYFQPAFQLASRRCCHPPPWFGCLAVRRPVVKLLWPIQLQLVIFTQWPYKERPSLAVGHHGDWIAQGTAVSVNRRSGIALAVHAGPSVMKYNVSMDSITQTDVSLCATVLFVSSMSLICCSVVWPITLGYIKQEAFEKCWAYSPQRAASRPFTRCR